jgi:hypothetical protein
MTKVINSPIKDTKLTLEERLALFNRQHGGEVMGTTQELGAEKLSAKFKFVAFKKQGF